MTGKILGNGVIRGDDGQRYYYDDGELKNAKDGQSIDGCEVDFDIKDGKAIEIYITATRDFSQEPSKDSIQDSIIDDEDDSDEEISIFEDKDNKFFHKGVVSNYRKEVVSHTSGNINISGVRRLPSGHIEGGGGGGSVSTTHYHTTYFDIGNKSFAWDGSNPISNGDEVALCSTPMTNGYNYVECLKNITKGLFFKKDYKEDDAYIACCKIIKWTIVVGGVSSFFTIGVLEDKGFGIAGFLSGAVIVVISLLVIISMMKARREIINSAKIINDAVLECE